MPVSPYGPSRAAGPLRLSTDRWEAAPKRSGVGLTDTTRRPDNGTPPKAGNGKTRSAMDLGGAPHVSRVGQGRGCGLDARPGRAATLG